MRYLSLFAGIEAASFTRAEMKPYIEAALRYGCDVEIIEATGDYGSIHNVPAATIERMRARDQHKVV